MAELTIIREVRRTEKDMRMVVIQKGNSEPRIEIGFINNAIVVLSQTEFEWFATNVFEALELIRVDTT